MPSSVPLSISVICLTTEHLLHLLSVTDYQYIVALNSDGARSAWRRERSLSTLLVDPGGCR
jgi:hypothetical protein